MDGGTSVSAGAVATGWNPPRPKTVRDIETPALVVDLDALEHNIRTISSALEGASPVLRPHVKNHKTPELARMQLDAGARGVTCATLGEAEAMFRGGITDILIANEVVGRPKIAHLVDLVRRGADVKVAVDSAFGARELSKAAGDAGVEVGVLVDLDVGLGRCGIEPGAKAVELARLVHSLPGLRLMGVMAYEGHAGMIDDPEKRAAACKRSLGLAVETKRAIEAAGLPCPVLSSSNTRTLAIAATVSGVSEIQAGMYLFMDPVFQTFNLPYKQAVFVLSTVISATGKRAIADGGVKSVTGFRGMPKLRDNPNWEVTRLSAEHAWLDTKGAPDLAVGDLVWLVPGYGDGVAVLHKWMYAVRGETVEGVWRIGE